MKRQTPKVGDTLFSLNIGNAARNRVQRLTPVVVKKVGRMYFYAGKEGFKASDRKYRIDDWSQYSEYMADSKLYVTEKEWEDERCASSLYDEIRGAINNGRGKIPLVDLVKIKAILDNPTPAAE